MKITAMCHPVLQPLTPGQCVLRRDSLNKQLEVFKAGGEESSGKDLMRPKPHRVSDPGLTPGPGCHSVDAATSPPSSHALPEKLWPVSGIHSLTSREIGDVDVHDTGGQGTGGGLPLRRSGSYDDLLVGQGSVERQGRGERALQTGKWALYKRSAKPNL